MRPLVQDHSGTLIAIKYQNFDDSGLVIQSNAGHGRAIFPGLTSWQNAGDIEIQDTPMNRDQDNLYKYTPNAGNTGLNFSQGVTRWTISGSLTIPASSFIVTGGFPEITGIGSTDNVIERSGTYSFGTIEPIINADSVRYAIYSSGSYIFANKPANNHTHNFGNNLLQYLTEGNGIISVTAFKWKEIEINNTKFNILHQTITYKNVTIQ